MGEKVIPLFPVGAMARCRWVFYVANRLLGALLWCVCVCVQFVGKGCKWLSAILEESVCIAQTKWIQDVCLHSIYYFC